MTPRSPIEHTHYLLAVGVIVMMLCLMCVVTIIITQVWLPPAAAKSGYVVRVCASVRYTGGFRVASWWGPAVSGRTGEIRQPTLQSNIACGFAPWKPGLPLPENFESTK
ncbi:MAG TPA: hypothetical protein VI547_13425 [Anaerolineales bacterium]|nr:hypothetical protein [Anaerolineales bacterium]